jgi:hypothetical protein
MKKITKSRTFWISSKRIAIMRTFSKKVVVSRRNHWDKPIWFSFSLYWLKLSECFCYCCFTQIGLWMLRRTRLNPITKSFLLWHYGNAKKSIFSRSDLGEKEMEEQLVTITDNLEDLTSEVWYQVLMPLRQELYCTLKQILKAY